MKKNKNSLQILLSLMRLVKPLAGYMVLAVVLGTAGFLAAIAIPMTGAWLICAAAGLVPLSGWTGWIVLMALCAIARGVLRYGEQACNHYIAFKLLAHIRDLVFGKLRTLGPARLDGKNKGDLISMLTSDVELLEVFYAHTISPVCIAVLVCLVFVIWAGTMNIYAALWLLVSYLCVGLFLPLTTGKKSGSAGRKYRQLAGKLSAYVLECTRGLYAIIQFNQEHTVLNTISKKTRELGAEEKKLKAMSSANTSATNTLITLFSLGMLAIVFVLQNAGSLSAVQAVLLVMMQVSTFGPVIALSNLSTGLAQTIGAGERVISLLEETPSFEPVRQGATVSGNEVDVRSVDFAYENEPVLQNFSRTFEKGKITGICGRSGCGKSTLLKLIMRFYDPDAGRIDLSGTNLKAIREDSLRTNESFVMQETILFHDTIENNLKLARPEASSQDIIDACKKASIHEFIMDLPDGYQSVVSELGSTLSGGEKQRLGLARAFLHNGPVLMLDEPTSNLDSLNEGMILKSIDEQKKERLTILVSHRKSSLQFCDDILEMEAHRT